jgi:hypothetical protein
MTAGDVSRRHLADLPFNPKAVLVSPVMEAVHSNHRPRQSGHVSRPMNANRWNTDQFAGGFSPRFQRRYAQATLLGRQLAGTITGELDGLPCCNSRACRSAVRNTMWPGMHHREMRRGTPKPGFVGEHDARLCGSAIRHDECKPSERTS